MTGIQSKALKYLAVILQGNQRARNILLRQDRIRMAAAPVTFLDKSLNNQIRMIVGFTQMGKNKGLQWTIPEAADQGGGITVGKMAHV